MKRKTLGIILLLVIVFTLTSCSSNATKKNDAKTNEETKIAEEKKVEEKKVEEAKKVENAKKAEATKKAEAKGTSGSQNAAPTKQTCTIYISCSNLVPIKGNLSSGQAQMIPNSGVILGTKTIVIDPGDTVLDITLKATRQSGIHLAYQGQAGAGTAYVQGINNIFEKTGDSRGGWIYKVNGTSPNKGCSSYTVSNGDRIFWGYTLTGGFDI